MWKQAIRGVAPLTEIAAARPSSTVVLVRASVGAPELLLMRRHQRSAFGGAHAFPGGVLEESDALVVEHCAGVTPAEADALLSVENGLAYFSAAIRELFEESGVLLAAAGRHGVDLAAARNALNAGAMDWRTFVSENEVRLDCGALQYFSFWITPVALPRRFSTRFFLAAMPEDQDAEHCGGELTDSCWLSAGDALAACRAGTISLHFPTRRTLEALAPHGTPEELLRWAAGRAREGVPCIFPEIEKRHGEARVLVGGRDSGALE
jgi:8-oxo-dGTP pyrophosphatase MutT (NUDIX family)